MFCKTVSPEGSLFVASEVTDNGVDLVILHDMLKSTFLTHWLFSLNKIDPIQKCFERGNIFSFFSSRRKIVMDLEFIVNPKNSITMLGSMQDFFFITKPRF